MGLTKAKVIIMRNNKEDTVDVLFNPSEYVVTSANKFSWRRVPGLQSPIAQFVSGEATTLTMDLFFDTYGTNVDVRTHTSKITDLLDVDRELHVPPTCRFVWGSLDFKGIVEKVTQRFTMFMESGEPVRATLNVTFKSVQSPVEQYRKVPRESADRTKQKTLKQDEQLWMLAAEEYDDPAHWREIAEANGIDNPRRLPVGRKLIIPRLE